MVEPTINGTPIQMELEAVDHSRLPLQSPSQQAADLSNFSRSKNVVVHASNRLGSSLSPLGKSEKSLLFRFSPTWGGGGASFFFCRKGKRRAWLRQSEWSWLQKVSKSGEIWREREEPIAEFRNRTHSGVRPSRHVDCHGNRYRHQGGRGSMRKYSVVRRASKAVKLALRFQ